jgi:hypothetical protein
MSDRRDPSKPDRRQMLPRPGGRRATDPVPSHGTRARYQKGCRCTPCRAAEAGYRADLRRRHQRQLPILGRCISASEAWARVRVLRQEQFTDQQITGWASTHAVRFTATSRVDPALARAAGAFVREQFGVEPDPWQLDVLAAFADPLKPRISMQACAGPGKPRSSPGAAGTSCPATPRRASIRRAPRSRSPAKTSTQPLAGAREVAGARSAFLSAAFTWTKTRIVANDHPRRGFSRPDFPKIGEPDEQGKTLSGLHSRFPLFLIDESGAMPTTVLRAAEQALQLRTVGKILQAGNTLSREGMLYAAATTLAHQWYIVRSPATPTIRSARRGSIGVGAAADRQTYGRENPWVQAYILGQFPPSSLNTL